MIYLRTKLCLILLLVSSVGSAKTDLPLLAASEIPKEIVTESTHAVLRYSQLAVTVNNLHDVRVTHSYAVTILDEKGKWLGFLREFYGKFSSIESIEGAVYDASGDYIRKLHEKDITDRATSSFSSYFRSDRRMKRYFFVAATYPYTVVYRITKKLNTTFLFPNWHPQRSHIMAVQKARFVLTYPESLHIRSKAYNMPEAVIPSVEANDGTITKTWKIKNMHSFRRQPLSDVTGYSLPVVVNAPSDFELFQYSGNMASWDSLGKFIYRLNDNRDDLPEKIKAKVQELVAGDTSVLQKVQTLFQFMQRNTRYVADEYGLARWQTFSAMDVCTKGYGDCKGLTNYMKALLKEAGITAYSCLINAGTSDYHLIDESFPTAAFNHDILCVPDGQDTIWVECTSRVNPAGYMGGFTQNRKVLVTTPTGGYLTNMPFYGKQKSYRTRTATVTFDPSQKQQHIQIQSVYSGILQDRLSAIVMTAATDDIKEFYNNRFSFPSYSVKNYDYKVLHQQIPPKIKEEVALESFGIVTTTAKRTFINIGWLANPMPEIVQAVPRTKPIVLRNDFRIVDSIILQLPPGLAVESIPPDVHLSFPFGTYDCHAEKSTGQVTLIRSYKQNSGIFDATAYDDYQAMYRKIESASHNLNVVLLSS